MIDILSSYKVIHIDTSPQIRGIVKANVLPFSNVFLRGPDDLR